MLARALRVVLVALALGSLTTAWWLGRFWNLGPGAVVVIAVGLFFVVPAAMIVATFVIAWRHRTVPPPELRIGPLAAIRCVLREIFSYIAVYVFLQPFPRLVLPAAPLSAAAGRPVVVLVHGYMCNAGGWAWLARYLIERGYAVHTVTLEPLFARIEDYVAPLARKVNEAAGEGGHVILLAHSMGGLVCRAYARRVGGAGIARIVTLGGAAPRQRTGAARVWRGRHGYVADGRVATGAWRVRAGRSRGADNVDLQRSRQLRRSVGVERTRRGEERAGRRGRAPQSAVLWACCSAGRGGAQGYFGEGFLPAGLSSGVGGFLTERRRVLADTGGARRHERCLWCDHLA